MSKKHAISSDIAFTTSVKEIQSRKGSRQSYAQMEANGGWQTLITDDLKQFIARQTSIFMATVNAEGQPYIQHRGGPPGFLRVLDEKTIAFADYRGNKQYISTGNLQDNPKAHLFLIDYEHKRRVKIWGEARVEESAQMMLELMPKDYRARGEQTIIFKITAWDANCPQHIPQRFEAADVERLLEQRDQYIAELEEQIAQLQGAVK